MSGCKHHRFATDIRTRTSTPKIHVYNNVDLACAMPAQICLIVPCVCARTRARARVGGRACAAMLSPALSLARLPLLSAEYLANTVRNEPLVQGSTEALQLVLAAFAAKHPANQEWDPASTALRCISSWSLQPDFYSHTEDQARLFACTC